MIAPTYAAPAVEFAALTGGQLRWGNSGEECVYADGSFVYWPFSGAVKLQQHGRVVTTIGSWSDSPVVLAAAYERAVAA